MKAAVVFIVILVGLSELSAAGDDEQPARFKITTKRKDDTAEVRAEKDRIVFAVKSPFGISQAVVERQEEKWPDAVLLRLHLKGLESFRAANGKMTLDAAVSSQDGKARLWKDGQENSPLDSTSPFWMDIRLLTGEGKPTTSIPLMNSYFEMRLPKAFLEGNPKSITLTWIDFYR